MTKKKDLFQELSEKNSGSNGVHTPKTKLNDNDLNKLIDTISPTVRPKKFELDGDIPFLQQLAEEHKKDGGDS